MRYLSKPNRGATIKLERGASPEWRFLNGGFDFKGGLQECVSSKPPALQGDRVAYRPCKRVGGHRRGTFEIREVMKLPFDGRAGSSRPAIPSQCEGFACRRLSRRGRRYGRWSRMRLSFGMSARPSILGGAHGQCVSKPPALQGDRVACRRCRHVGGHRRGTSEIRGGHEAAVRRPSRVEPPRDPLAMRGVCLPGAFLKGPAAGALVADALEPWHVGTSIDPRRGARSMRQQTPCIAGGSRGLSPM
jgi:hypothetical protein